MERARRQSLLDRMKGAALLIAGIIGIRQALDFGTGRAILTALLGFVPYIIAMAAVSAVLNLPGRAP